MKPSPPSSRLPRWATGAGLLVLLPVAGWALGRRFAQARCSETATLLGSDPRLAKHAAQTREARGEAVFPLAWPARAPMHAPAPEPLYNAPNPTQRVAFVVESRTSRPTVATTRLTVQCIGGIAVGRGTTGLGRVGGHRMRRRGSLLVFENFRPG